MLIKLSIFTLTLSVMFFFSLCSIVNCKETNIKLHNDFHADIWVPKTAQDVRYYDLNKIGKKQVIYTLKDCYPALDVTRALEKAMVSKNWTRLNEDFLNPGTKLNPARGEWSSYQDEKGQQGFTWMDDWTDRDGNIIRYVLTYVNAKREDMAKMCDLRVLGLYIPQKGLTGG